MEKRKWDYIRDGHWQACQAGVHCQPEQDEQDDSAGMVILLIAAVILLAIVIVVVSI